MTAFVGSKADEINNDYLLANKIQLVGLTTAEITAQSATDANGTLYHNVTLNKLQAKLNGAIETITSA